MATTANSNSTNPATVFPRSHVGFDSITSQIERKLLKRGFQFNVMCVGMWAATVQLFLERTHIDCVLYSTNRPDRSRKVDSD